MGAPVFQFQHGSRQNPFSTGATYHAGAFDRARVQRAAVIRTLQDRYKKAPQLCDR